MSRASSKQQPGWRGLAVLCVVVVVVGVGGDEAGSAPADLVCDWDSTLDFGQPAFDNVVRTLVVGDLGTGQAVYAGGDFTIADAATANHVARWDGVQWTALGTGVDGTVSALAVFDDGSGPALYAGGLFVTAGGVTAYNIARWDGEAWNALIGPSGWGTDGQVLALAVHDDGRGPALFIGGKFLNAGGIEAHHVARWDGSAWSTLAGPGNGTSDDVYALAEFDDGSGPALYAGGLFDFAGGATANKIARWDGSVWSGLGQVWSSSLAKVLALAVYASPSGPRLIAGGYFDYLKSLASWDGAAWSPVGGGIYGDHDQGYCYSLASVGGDLYVGGKFKTAGSSAGVAASNVVRWNGSTFSPLTGPTGNGLTPEVSPVYALALYDDGTGSRLLAGGAFGFAGGVPVNYVASWSTDGWTVAGGSLLHGLDGSAAAMIDSVTGSLVVGGEFFHGGALSLNNIGLWTGSAWSALSGPAGTGTDGSVLSLARFDDGGGEDLYAGGEFSTAGGSPASAVATWDGAAWSPLQGSGSVALDGRAEALVVCDLGGGPALFAGGSFSTAGGITVNNVARWDGSAWWPLTGSHGTGTSGVVRALECYDDGTGPSLYVGGRFNQSGSVVVNNVARWDGAEWFPLIGLSGIGVSWDVLAMEVYDDGGGERLYVGGAFQYAGGIFVSGVATWDGLAWDRLYTPFGVGVTGSVASLVVGDDGRGPALFVGGAFGSAGGEAASNVARWDGTTWTALAGSTGFGTDGTVLVLHPHVDGGGPALYAGGDFTTAGGIPSSRIARWSCAESPLFQDGFESGTLAAWSRADP